MCPALDVHKRSRWVGGERVPSKRNVPKPGGNSEGRGGVSSSEMSGIPQILNFPKGKAAAKVGL